MLHFQLEALIDEYEGKPLPLGQLTAFDQTMLNFFVNSDFVDDPYIDVSLIHDISAAARNFDVIKALYRESTFSAFLLWSAAKSLLEIRHLNWRYFNNSWYEFNNLPFFMPIQTGNDEARLASVILKNIKYSCFSDFVEYYNASVAKARTTTNTAVSDPSLYLLSHHLVNLPALRFTSLKPQTPRIKNTNVSWIFGQRYEENGILKVPMMIRMHHSNGDPLILDQLLKTFSTKIAQSIF
jgi:chloramphenicol O-acetyltransferase type A